MLLNWGWCCDLGGLLSSCSLQGFGKMDPVKEFVVAPSVKLLQQLKVEELWRVMEHYKLSLEVAPSRSKKKEVVAAIQAEPTSQGILEEVEMSPPTSPLGGAVGGIGMGVYFHLKLKRPI